MYVFQALIPFSKGINKLSPKQKAALIRKVNNDWINDRLRGKGPTKNIFWKTFDEELQKAKKTFCQKFIELLFRMDLNKLMGKASSQFKFYLLTGIGKQTSTGIFVEKAEVKDLQPPR